MIQKSNIRGIYHFIIEQKKAYSETFKTESGLELYGDKRFMAHKLANRICTVVNIPMSEESEIKPGYEVMIDPSIYTSITTETGGERNNPNLIDKAKGWYKIDPDIIVLYRENEQSEWRGNKRNLVVEYVKEDEKTSNSLIIQTVKSENKKGVAKVKYSNTEMEGYDVNNGDEILFGADYNIPFPIDGKEYYWMNNSSVIGKKE
jgi:co-chaperonin GroES (HSP10)